VENSTTVTVDVAGPKSRALYQHLPNPSNPSTTIQFDLQPISSVRLEIYNIPGQRIYDENRGVMNAGRYDESPDMNRFASGVYICQLAAVGNNEQKFVAGSKMILMR
jgi:hypothetical protein